MTIMTLITVFVCVLQGHQLFQGAVLSQLLTAIGGWYWVPKGQQLEKHIEPGSAETSLFWVQSFTLAANAVT